MHELRHACPLFALSTARVLAICGRFRGPISGPPACFLATPSATPLPTQKARNHYFCYILAIDRRPPEGTLHVGVHVGVHVRFHTLKHPLNTP